MRIRQLMSTAGNRDLHDPIQIDDGNALDAEGTIDVRDAGGVQQATVPWRRPGDTYDVRFEPDDRQCPGNSYCCTPES